MVISKCRLLKLVWGGDRTRAWLSKIVEEGSYLKVHISE